MLGNARGHANVTNGFHPQASGIDAAELQQLLAEIRRHIPGLPRTPNDTAGLQAAMAELDAADPAKTHSQRGGTAPP